MSDELLRQRGALRSRLLLRRFEMLGKPIVDL